MFLRCGTPRRAFPTESRRDTAPAELTHDLNCNVQLRGVGRRRAEPSGFCGGTILDTVQLKETDPAKAEKLQKEYDKLIALRNSAQVKSTAKAMATEM